MHSILEGNFVTVYHDILDKIQQIDPVAYGATRNYTDGAVTYISPYLSRGVISTQQVIDTVMKKGFAYRDLLPLVRELGWREYFQRVAQHKDVNRDIRQPQQMVSNHSIPLAVIEANTGIEAIDSAITQLYHTGYMHNHCRMYTASLVCNISQSHWYVPARWMYYHLLDGDWPTNACSWQWVAGNNSQKKYFANQENINRFTYTGQTNTFLDLPYESLPGMAIPNALKQLTDFSSTTSLPASQEQSIDETLPFYMYNYYNLDPLWHQDEPGNRILLLEPDFFNQYPVSAHCINFIMSLANNINGIQIYTGSFKSLLELYPDANVYYKEHPLNTGYAGHEEPRGWIAPEITGYFPSFSAYWKKMSPYLEKKYA